MNNIRFYRKKSNLTQQQLANRCNVCKATIINVENGRCRRPYILLKIAIELDVSLKDLFQNWGDEIELAEL